MAAQAGQLPCIKWLVEKASIPVRLRATDGATPAHFAAANGEVSKWVTLSLHILDVECYSYFEQVMCLEWILDHGGSALDQDNSGGTLIHDAAEQGQVCYTLSNSHINIDSVHTMITLYTIQT